MSSLDDQLRQALKRKEPSGDFTARVLAAARSEVGKRKVRWWNPARLAPVAALLTLSSFLGYQEYERRSQGERAKQQLMVALRLTGVKLLRARQRVEGISDGKDLLR